jgi:hypothetical protein
MVAFLFSINSQAQIKNVKSEVKTTSYDCEKFWRTKKINKKHKEKEVQKLN